ncbi:MAG TPA: HEAT repeat domain-containing protein [Methanothermobacter sp.]|nr:PBS lyase HEAT domain protein repeat-containing protein [Methanothermobacter sp. MT-2]HHW04897.1 HEAT repeat domain-containing protein [Methanothermobacter sp.]HOK73256.1 HEAT repeat domain-containing protein [Methanothermobacter sp.]HOL69549.1 HEAT repeat domain-containing protein [Methanothermobacter sp.]HPQ05120.1 HEAT repeat domain-containing protein [Methanothermobacter sp.]
MVNEKHREKIIMINKLPRTVKSVDALVDLLEDESHSVRFAAAEKLAEFGEISLKRLIRILEEEKGPIRRYATFALRKIGDPTVTDHFIKALEDEDWGVRKFAARALGELGDNRAVEPLIRALEDEDWGVRLAAVRSLGDLKDERAVEPIKKARRKGDKEFKKAANQALRRIQS